MSSCWGGLGAAPVREPGKRTGQEEKLTRDVVTAQSPADPTERATAGMALQSCPKEEGGAWAVVSPTSSRHWVAAVRGEGVTLGEDSSWRKSQLCAASAPSRETDASLWKGSWLAVLLPFTCHLDSATVCPDVELNIILGVSVRVFSG